MLREIEIFILKIIGVKFYTAPDGSVFYPRKKATPRQILEAEKELGFEIPEILKSVLVDIGDGGFGPGYGLMCLRDIVKEYNFFKEPDPNESDAFAWPEGVLPILTTGCGLFYCVHCLESNNPVYSTGDHCYDNLEAEGTIESILLLEKTSLKSWMESWK